MPETQSGGRLIVESLKLHRTSHVFGVAGESYLEALDAFYGSTVDFVTCRHEGGAAFMAEAYAKLTGRPGVVFVTRGPGAFNASIGLHAAMQDQTPLVALIGQVQRSHSDREVFQEVDYRAVFGPMCKLAVQIESTDRIPEYMARAFHVAVSGRPGPVVLALPEDMLTDRAEPRDYRAYRPSYARPSASQLDAVVEALKTSRRPLLLLGGGGWGEGTPVAAQRLLDVLGLPTIVAFRRHDLIDTRSDCFIGEMSGAPSKETLEALRQCDLLLVVGARLEDISSGDFNVITPPHPGFGLIHVFPAAEELGRLYQPDIAIVSAPAEFMRSLATRSREIDPVWAEWRDDRRRSHVLSLRDYVSSEPDLRHIMQVIDDTLPRDAIVTIDAGNFAAWPQRFVNFGAGRRLIGPSCGAMGYAVPAAVAASILNPGRAVVAFVGDGGFAMTSQELATARQRAATPIIVVLDNAMFGTIRMHQAKHHPGRIVGTSLSNPDFALLARAYGLHGETVSATGDFAPALARAKASGTAAVIHVQMDRRVMTTREYFPEATPVSSATPEK